MSRLRIGAGVMVLAALIVVWQVQRPSRPSFPTVSVIDEGGDVQANPKDAEVPRLVDLLDVSLADRGTQLAVEFRHAKGGPEPRRSADSDQSVLGYTLTLWEPDGDSRSITAVVKASPTWGWDAPSEPTVYVCRHGSRCSPAEGRASGSIDLAPDSVKISVPWDALGGAHPEGFKWVLMSHWTVRGSDYRQWLDEVPNAGTLPPWHDSTDGPITVRATFPEQPPDGAAEFGP